MALQSGDVERARAALGAATELLERLADRSDPAWRNLHRLRARLAVADMKPDSALAHADAALTLARAQAIDAQASTAVGEDLLLRAEVLAAQGAREGAARDTRAAVVHFERTADPSHPALAQARRLAG